MKRVVESIVISLSIGALSLGTSLWASSSTEEDGTSKKTASPLPPQRKDARHFTSEDTAPWRSQDLRYHDEDPDFNPGPYETVLTPPTNRSPNAFEIELAERLKITTASSSNNASEEEKATEDSPKLRKKTAKRTHSTKSPESDSPKQPRKRADSKTKKDLASVESELLSSSSKATRSKVVLPEVIETTFVEEDDVRGPAMYATIASTIVSAPATLTFDEVSKLLAIPLVNRKISLGYGATLNGDVVTAKEEIQGGLASHKLPAPGVERIAGILDAYPEAFAMLDIDEIRHIHTLSDQGFKGVVGHYYLVQPLENGKFERLSSSEFSIAYAVKPLVSKKSEATSSLKTN